MTYDQLMKNHLSNYKKTKLAITEAEKWRGGTKDYHYILPIDKRELNLLSPYRNETENYVKAEKIKLHQFFHHLNSSQAMCLNFFYPLIAEHRLSLMLNTLNLPDEPIEEAAFEHMMPGGERTNFDFYMKLKSGKEILFEIKYTEKGFGKSTSRKTIERQYENIYREMLTGKIRSGVDGLEALVKNYQLLRNIAYLDQGDERLLVIICPAQNLKLHKEYNHVMNNMVVPELHKNIRIVTWESLLQQVNTQLKADPSFSSKLRKHYNEFEEKYL